MATYAVKLEQSGRIILPAELRRKMGLKPGEDVLIHVDEEGISVVGNRRAVVRALQEELRPYLGGAMLSEELSAERRAEAAEEDER